MNKKRKIVNILVLSMSLSFMVGCGEGSSSTSLTMSSDSASTTSSSSTYPHTPDIESDLLEINYSNNSKIKNCADGVMLISKKGDFSSVSSLKIAWGDSEGIFEDYSLIKEFDEFKSSDFEVEFSNNSLIPSLATKVWVTAYDASNKVISKASLGMEDYKQEQKIQYEFQVISDEHVTNTSSAFYRRTKKSFEDIKEISPDSQVIVSNGDMVDEGKKANYEAFSNAYNSVYGSSSQEVLYGLGNHEFMYHSESSDYSSVSSAELNNRYSSRLELWKEYTGNESAYFSKVINGSYFIFLGTTAMPNTLDGNTKADCTLGEKQLAWFNETMEKAGKTNKPIYLFSHGSLRNTVSGSLTSLNQTWYGYSVNEEYKIRNIIKNYPQTLFFSSHSHWSFESQSPYVINDDYPSFFNTASVGYLWQGNGSGEHYQKGDYENGGGQGLFLEVYEDQIHIKGRQFEASDKTSKYWYSGYQVVLPM